MQKNLLKKCLVIGVILLFFLIFISQNYTLYCASVKAINDESKYITTAIKFNYLNKNIQSREIIWNVTLSFIEPDGANDYTVFGEAPDANDGPPPDVYDQPKPPLPPSLPYILAWFNDNLSEPYNLLWKDFRSFPDTFKQWNLTLLWVPEDGQTPTDVTISWSIDEIDDSEYFAVKLCDSDGNQLTNMLTEKNYTFNCPAIVPQIFYIICQIENVSPEKPDEPSGQTQCNINVEYNYSSKTVDMDGNQIYYWFDWGDDTNSDWIGPYPSGETVSANHIWTKEGVYQVKVKAKDTLSAESPWSDPLTVTVDSTPPTIKIIKPVKGLYIIDKMIRRFFIRIPFIIGGISIEVNATDNESGIDRIEFYGGILGTKYLGNDTEEPYNYFWKRDRIRFIHLQILKVVAYDNVGNKAVKRMIVHKFL